MRRDGFTLIELLIVIAIIAVLAAMLFRVFSRAREKTRQMGCFSGLQSGTGLAMHVSIFYDDHAEWFKEKSTTMAQYTLASD